MIKQSILIMAVVFLVFPGCGTETYPDINYKNIESVDIRFKTAELDSDWYTVGAGAAISLSSENRGRTQVTRIEQFITNSWEKTFITWEYAGWDTGDIDIYNIEFLKHNFRLIIKNFSDHEITITEKFNLISLNNDDIIKIPARTDVEVILHTKKPVLQINPVVGYAFVDKDGEDYYASPGINTDQEPFFIGFGSRPLNWWDK